MDIVSYVESRVWYHLLCLKASKSSNVYIYRCQPPLIVWQGTFLSLVERREEFGLQAVWVTHSPHSTTLHHPREACGRAAAPALRRVLGSAARVRWGMVVRWAPHWAKARSRSVARCIAAGQKTDCEPWLSTSAPETVPSAQGLGGSIPPISDQLQSPRHGPERPCRGREHGQDAVRAAERWDICLARLAMFYLQGAITVRFI